MPLLAFHQEWLVTYEKHLSDDYGQNDTLLVLMLTFASTYLCKKSFRNQVTVTKPIKSQL